MSRLFENAVEQPMPKTAIVRRHEVELRHRFQRGAHGDGLPAPGAQVMGAHVDQRRGEVVDQSGRLVVAVGRCGARPCPSIRVVRVMAPPTTR